VTASSVSPWEHPEIEPAVSDHGVIFNGEAVGLIREIAPQLVEAPGPVLRNSRKSRRRTLTFECSASAAAASRVSSFLSTIPATPGHQFGLEAVAEIRSFLA